MPGTPMPFVKAQWLDANGDPYSGAQLFTYLTGTTTKSNTYTDQALTTPNANPIILDSAGRATVFLAARAYKFVLAPATDTDPPASALWTQDAISSVPFYNVSTTIGRIGNDDKIVASDNVQTLTIPYHPIIVSNAYWASSSMTTAVTLPANTMSTNGDALILEWEMTSTNADLAARATCFGVNIDLGTGTASIKTFARLVMHRIDNTEVSAAFTVIQNTADPVCIVANSVNIVTTGGSLDLAATAYTLSMGMVSGTFVVVGARILYMKGFAAWAS